LVGTPLGPFLPQPLVVGGGGGGVVGGRVRPKLG
jgi:hypothetical protein